MSLLAAEPHAKTSESQAMTVMPIFGVKRSGVMPITVGVGLKTKTK